MKRLECLDGLRGLLAVYVMLGHLAPFAVLPAWLQVLLSHGQAAVDMFFVLSGLVITQSLLKTGGQMVPFLILRATRIFPVFLPVFALAVLVEPWSCGFERMPWIGPDDPARTICVVSWPDYWVPEIVAHLTMTHGLFPNGVLRHVWVSFLGSAWSLSTEWQFYGLALLAANGWRWRRRPVTADPPPVLGAGIGRARGPALTRFGAGAAAGPAVDRPMLCWMLLALSVAALAWRLSVPLEWQFSRAFLPNKAHFFALGVASFAVVRGEQRALVRYGFMLTVCLLLCASQGVAGKLVPPLAWTCCLAVEVLSARPQAGWFGVGVAGRVLRSRPARYLGAISYSLYLVNEPIHKLLVAGLSMVANADAMLFTLLWVPLATVLPLLASAWLHVHVETPALQWGRSAAARSGKHALAMV